MPLSLITATVSIVGISPLCQSRYHDEPALEGEQHDAYDIRTWRLHLHVKNGTVHIPAKALHDALTEAAKYSKRQIPGQGKATWTQKFASGIAFLDDGTMVVVDGARRFINRTVDILVTSTHQTPAGKMIFGRLEDRPESIPPRAPSASTTHAGTDPV